MRILFVSQDLLAGNLVLLLQKEGHEVKLFVEDKCRHDNFVGMVNRIDDWRSELQWVGKEGLIIFDDLGYGRVQDDLRKDGYAVVGGSELGDKLESDRAFGQSIFESVGMKTYPLYDFEDLSQAVEFIKANPEAWVIKQNGDQREFNYVGQFCDGSDTISVLENYMRPPIYPYKVITLQKRILGVEVGVGRYFNGKDWVGPIEMNIEHKNLFPHDLGPATCEMGTVAWYTNNENNKLYQETLARLKSFLQRANFKGDIAVNCIANKKGIYPLEATARFGLPIIHLQTELNISPWGEFLDAIARGKEYDLQYKDGYGVVVSVVVPPFPYHLNDDHPLSIKGARVIFDPAIKDDMHHVHFDELAIEPGNPTDNQYIVSDNRGYLLYVTSSGESVYEAQKEMYRIVNCIHAPKMYYRHDIGERFESRDKQMLADLDLL